MQIRNSFDRETIKKIIKGFGYSFLAGLSAFLTSYSMTENIKVALATGLAAMIAPFTANTAIQYNKGE